MRIYLSSYVSIPIYIDFSILGYVAFSIDGNHIFVGTYTSIMYSSIRSSAFSLPFRFLLSSSFFENISALS